MQPYQQRVIAEKADLDDKRTKLRAFILGPKFSSLDLNEQDRMTRQLLAMTTYSSVLGERIAAFA